ncbi:hypothetical protein BU26DRAFT_520704 [Trematosphaeria pertusa]|uniref:F-box domain-containing protein n=1 Tax=Trematosphaeria pertusa TaxID=390896 RepID=A0A6A6IDG3_9PLEO|nr:uncharacterized protein BU26DRAFT_520704 [Trematosphaeria pertusa]KAF2247600.1 hypothetical protein BU26DRAFT_520704 [Trematosphaeria pertusa]
MKSARLQQRALGYAAAASVFNVPELLENILSNLDLRTLLTSAQRVSRRWRATVTGSPLLQRLLYLEPEQQRNGHRVPNPLLVEASPACFYHNPIGCDQVFFDSDMCRTSSSKAFMFPGATWRRMLLTQIPIERLGCWTSEYERGSLGDDTTWMFKILEFPSGLRMGKLYDLCQRWVSTTSSANFALFWEPTTVREYDFFKQTVEPRRIEALRECGAAVELLWRGERRNGPSKHSKKDVATFRRRFTYRDENATYSLEPARDSGYKPPTQWAAEKNFYDF